ncbi:MAG: FliO/MopB family protein [Spirochaetota bacterium]
MVVSKVRIHLRAVLDSPVFFLVILTLFLIIVIFFPPYLLAQEKASEKPSASEGEGIKKTDGGQEETTPGTQPPAYEYNEPEFGENKTSYPFLILRTLAVLGVIIVGIYLLFRLLLKNKNKIVTDSEIIKVLATYPLAANRVIQIVDIAGQVLILGVSDANINLITEISDKEVIDRIKLMSSKESKITTSFKDQFFKLIGGKTLSRPGQISYLSGYKKRIDRMKKF